MRRALRLVTGWARRSSRRGEHAGTNASSAHVRVVDATALPHGAARRLARSLARSRTEGQSGAVTAPRLVVLAGPRNAGHFARAGLTVETAATRQDRDRALVRYGAQRTVRAVPLGRSEPVILAPVRVVAAAEVEGGTPALGPILVGGTGRSGTWALGRLLGEHPDRVTVHTELRFHAHDRAFSRLLDGSLRPERYAETFLERYYGITSQDGTAKGIQLLASRWEVQQALTAFREAATEDLPAAMGALVRRLVDPYARARRAAGWVETTPGNVSVADALTACLPDAHVVHIVRDGRDVAASMASMAWGPSDPVAALQRWADGLRTADAAFARADPARVHVVRFEDLVVRDRARTLTALLDALGTDDRDRIEARFDRKLDPARSNIGRWRRDAGADVEAAVDTRYRALLHELSDEGVGCLPVDPQELDDTREARP